MKPPSRKVLPKSPDVLKRMIPEALEMKYGGVLYDEEAPCPSCGCEDVIRHDSAERAFCVTIAGGGFRPVNVRVKRFRCRMCGRVFEGRGPFYQGCLYASPIVDLCLSLAASNPYNRVESILMEHGIQVDSLTVRNYVLRFRERMEKRAGMPAMDGSKVGVNLLKALFDVSSVEELRRRYPGAKYDALMEETYPRVKGAKKEMEGGTRKYPRSFTLASSYLAHQKCFSSIWCREAPFNSIMAEVLAMPLKGADAIVTDGFDCYNGIRSYACLFHKMRNFFTKDPFLQGLKQPKDGRIPPGLISSYMQDVYAFAKGRRSTSGG